MDPFDKLEAGLSAGVDPMLALARALAGEPSPRTDPFDLTGREIDGCVITKLIGRGGMGSTYEALAPEGGRVAIKVVESVTEESRERFLRECAILGRLRHEFIVGYRRYGFLPQGNAYLVMELIDGPNLQDILEDVVLHNPRFGLTLDLLEGITVRGDDVLRDPSWHRRVLRIAADLADALQAAHDAGVIHRDLKPGNVLLRPNLTPVLIDFGLSRDLFKKVSLTRSAETMGTWSYMAPEQFERDPGAVDCRTDVFALGLLLYRALLGRDLREEARDVFEYHKRPLLLDSRATRHLPASLLGILYWCLDPRPDRRYGSARALAIDLRNALGSGRVRARTPGPLTRTWRTSVGRTAFLGSGVLVASMIAWLALRRPHLLTISAVNFPGAVKIDGVPFGQAPVNEAPISSGEHVLEYTSQYSLPLRQNFSVSRPRERLNLMTVSVNPNTAPVPDLVLYPGEDRVLLHWRSRDPSHQRSLSGTILGTDIEWLWVAPGPYTFEATDPGRSIRETQDVELRAAHLEDIRLLVYQEFIPAGSFWCSWSSVMSPMPDRVSLELGDGAVLFISEARDPVPLYSDARLAGRGIQFSTYVTADRPRTPVEARLTVHFPERMRSAIFQVPCIRTAVGTVDIAYRCDDGAWMSCGIDDSKPGFEVAVPTDGMMSLTVRGTIRVEQMASAVAYGGFLSGYVASDSTLYPAVAPPAFWLVADPGPNVAVLGTPR